MYIIYYILYSLLYFIYFVYAVHAYLCCPWTKFYARVHHKSEREVNYYCICSRHISIHHCYFKSKVSRMFCWVMVRYGRDGSPRPAGDSFCFARLFPNQSKYTPFLIFCHLSQPSPHLVPPLFPSKTHNSSLSQIRPSECQNGKFKVSLPTRLPL